MRALAWVACVGLMGVCGCASDAGTTGEDVVQTVDGRSAVDTLVLLLSVRSRTAKSIEWIDNRQIRLVELSVDGRPWGTFEVDEGPVESSDWVMHEQPSEALVVAELGHQLERTDDPLDTIDEWLMLLEQHLAPGGHVAEIEAVYLEVGRESVRLAPQTRVPFSIAQGDMTAYVGQVAIDLEASAP